MKVFYLPITEDYTELDAALVPYVSVSRQERIARYVHDSHKKLALYAGLLARMALSLSGGIPVEKLLFSYGNHQKPALENRPPLYFNLSHTKGGVLCGISTETDVGVDIEAIRRPTGGVLKKAFHPAELAAYDQAKSDAAQQRIFGPTKSDAARQHMDDQAKNDAARQHMDGQAKSDAVFTRIWTRKEAYTKQLGCGIACELTKINTLSDELSARITTWQEDGFFCSACGDLADFQKITTTAGEIRQFYLPSSDVASVSSFSVNPGW